ncbi:MAG: Ca2+-transporting ATPase, partial [Planctomycetota bacterium]
LERTVESATTVAFLTLAFAQLWHVFNMRNKSAPFFRNDITENFWIWGALALCTLLLFGALFIPVVAAVLELQIPTMTEWALIGVFSIIPVLVGLVVSAFGRPRQTLDI